MVSPTYPLTIGFFKDNISMVRLLKNLIPLRNNYWICLNFVAFFFKIMSGAHDKGPNLAFTEAVAG